MLTKKKELYNRRRQRSEIDRILQKQRAFFAEGKTYEIRFRKAALKRLEASILAHEKEVCQALTEDLGKSETEGYMCEVGLMLAEIRETAWSPAFRMATLRWCTSRTRWKTAIWAY